MSSVALSLSGIALAMVVLAPPLAHFEVLPPLRAFTIWLASVLPAGAAIGVALLAIVIKRGVFSWNVAAIVLALVPVLLLASVLKTGSAVPRINDITTDLSEPPAFVQAKEIRAYPEKFKEKVRVGYPDLAPAFRDGSKADAFDRTVAAAKELGWEVTFTDAAAGHLEAVSTSPLWKFRDDVVVRVRDDAGKVRIDIRSRSRDGEGDFGANAARIRTFFAKL